jgi:hypothetical protein
LHSDPDRGGLFLYGDIVNQSDSPQELKRVTGTFLDAQGQIVADETNTSDYSPIQIVPSQGQVPFELVVDNIQSAADFELRAEAEPSSDTLRQDFEITDSYQDNDEFGLCVGGTLRNPGGDLTQYVVVAAILYDAQDNVISFGDTYFEPGELASGQTGEFEVCADSFNQAVSRYELQAWGQ